MRLKRQFWTRENKMAKFRKRPVVIEAEQINFSQVIDTLEGTMQGNPGDWLITGTRGEKYFCKDDIFKEIYDPVEEKQE